MKAAHLVRAIGAGSAAVAFLRNRHVNGRNHAIKWILEAVGVIQRGVRPIERITRLFHDLT